MAITTIAEQTIDGMRVLYLGPSALVASERTTGAWYSVEPGTGCTCPDHQYRGRVCKHMRAAQLAAELDRAQAVGIEAVTPRPRAADLLVFPE